MEKLVEFANAAKLRSCATTYSQIEDSYLFTHITPGSNGLSELVSNTPLKLGGTFIMLMLSGTPVNIEINQDTYTIRPGCFVDIFPGFVVNFNSQLPNDIDMYAMFFDTKFSQNININMTSIALPSIVERPKPVSQLSKDECKLLCKYFELLHINTIDGTNTQINKTIATSLVAAMFYQLVQFYHKRLAGELNSSPKMQLPGRRHDYVREFVKLVHLHYTRERAVSFYADKLFISPKYLSLLVKEATGRSAAKWIDEFVLMEAKNMLRFSGKNIQQVAYALNFPTQSSFGKYFKHLTGMSPTEYQKS